MGGSGNGASGPWISQDQWMGLARQFIPFIAGMAIAKGWLTTDEAASLASLALQIAGPIGLIVGAIWTYVANSKKSILISASQMPEVKKVVVSDLEIAKAVPSTKVDTQ